MSTNTPSFRKPPLVEVALSVQFSPLAGLTNSMLGVLWYQELAENYPKQPQDAPPIDAQFERFGDQHRVGLGFPRLMLGTPPTRAVSTSANGDRMVQVQNGRLAVNWLRGDGNVYKRFSPTRDELLAVLAKLQRFTNDRGLGDIELNQWEVTYVNLIEQGALWKDPASVAGVLPGLFGSGKRFDALPLDSIESSWHFLLPSNAGRLHVDVKQGWTAAEAVSAKVLLFQLTARGPVESENFAGLVNGLNLGHESVVKTFAAVTSEEAHRLWERTE